MDSRVVARMTRAERKRQVIKTLILMERKGYKCTTRALARQCFLSPSTWFYNLLTEMYVECKIECKIISDKHRRDVRLWRSFVRIPGDCDAIGQECGDGCDICKHQFRKQMD